MNTSIENIVYTEFTKKKVFEQLTLAVACSTRHRPPSVMVLNKQLTRVYSLKDPRLHFGESFTLKWPSDNPLLNPCPGVQHTC